MFLACASLLDGLCAALNLLWGEWQALKTLECQGFVRGNGTAQPTVQQVRLLLPQPLLLVLLHIHAHSVLSEPLCNFLELHGLLGDVIGGTKGNSVLDVACAAAPASHVLGFRLLQVYC